MNRIEKLASIAAMALASAVPANGLTFVTGEPFAQPTQYLIDFSAENNDAAAVYDSAITDILKGLSELYNLGSNSAIYSSFDDMINTTNMLPSLRAPPTGDSFSGWSTSSSNGGQIGVEHVAGDLGLDYTVWDTDADSSKMSLTSVVDYALLEDNGTAGYQPFGLADLADVIANPGNYDPVIVRTDNALLQDARYTGSAAGNMATFTAESGSGFTQWSNTAPSYALIKPSDFAVVPEPRSFALIAGLTALGLLARRRS